MTMILAPDKEKIRKYLKLMSQQSNNKQEQ